MDSDIEFSDEDILDYGSECSHQTPFPIECQNEAESIESFSRCFICRYSACPAFFIGTLQEACESASSSSIFKEHRPILVYIHHDKSVLSNIFCSNIFCSEILVDYLLENYIVWPWDITHESNWNRLMEIWKELFSIEIPVGQCPMLIGIMRTSSIGKDWSFKARYRFTLLLENNMLICTQIELTRERLLNELISFKEQSDRNEQNLSFDFTTTTGLPWDIILEIAKYLTLNDAVIAFSTKILPLFLKYKTKLHLSEPSKPFMDMIFKTIKLEQIVSLQIDASRLWSKSDLTIFNHITSLNLYNIEHKDHIHNYEESFPNLNYLSLYYDNELDFKDLFVIVNRFQRSIKRLEIHCAAVLCPSLFQHPLDLQFRPNITIEYFLLDIRHFPLNLMNRCFLNYQSCFLMQIVTLIKIMKNIRYIHFLTSQYNIEKLLDINEWRRLIDECYQLKKVTLQVIGNGLQNEQLIQKILEIQNIRQTIKFRILIS